MEFLEAGWIVTHPIKGGDRLSPQFITPVITCHYPLSSHPIITPHHHTIIPLTSSSQLTSSLISSVLVSQFISWVVFGDLIGLSHDEFVQYDVELRLLWRRLYY